MTKQPAIVILPRFLRMVGRHRASDWSFGLAVCRGDIPEGCFGHIAPYWCFDCEGPCGEPDCVCTARETWGYYGGQPAEYENACPACGCSECGEHDDPELRVKVVNRYRIPTRKRR